MRKLLGWDSIFGFTCDITRSTMTPRKLHKLKLELASYRRSQAKAADLESLASRLGRKKVKRGSEPTWESQEFADVYPLSIPHHGGKDLPIGTRRSILDQLQEDVFAWERRLDEKEDDEDGETDDSDNGTS
jgi:hypothetical protein